MPISGLGFNGGGFSGGGFGRVPGEPVQFLGDAGGAGAPMPSTQAAGVAQWGAVWASNNCPSCKTAILEMQNQINRAAAAFGVPIRLTLDGKVGAQTVGALQGIAQAVMGRYATAGLELRSYATAEAVAKNADVIRDKVKQVVKVKNGIETEDAKKITKLIKESKIKVQASIQGDAVRVTGAKRDDLQAAMALLRKDMTELPLSFDNFRD